MELYYGDIISFNYHGKNVHDKRPTILLLGHYKGLFHGLNLNYMSKAQQLKLRDVFKKTRLNLIPPGDIERDPKGFYLKKIKPYIEDINSSVYRTYTTDKVYSLKIVDSYLRGGRVQDIIQQARNEREE